MCLQRYGRLSLRPAAVFLRGAVGKVAEALAELGLVASHYDGYAQGKAGVLDSMLIPAFSMLIKQGTACAVEGDMKIAIAMSILKTISGTGQLSEMYSIDFPRISASSVTPAQEMPTSARRTSRR